ncbi:hypothetical protein BLNAU_22026 [Blattamonas nauphoetae]|uniref:Uncharacterized protein n=1 Tax=Blattamonas nauphoetae TaxID=2049346 RepID=A0ABQ9WU77_9EUKA|nr:hypothetical protein BLNAU_22026 [Blattamonas nauphoetae]
MTSTDSNPNGDLSRSVLSCPPSWNLSNISSLLKRLQCDDENMIVDSFRELQKCCSCLESLFFEPEIVDSLLLHHKDLIVSTFNSIAKSTPSPAVVTTLARLSLFPHLRIAYNALHTLLFVVKRNPHTFSLLPSPIFPSYSPHQQYSGLSFLAALTKKLPIVFTEFQTYLPTDPSHFPKYILLLKDDQFIITPSLLFCSNSSLIPHELLLATPPIEVDSEIFRDFILFVKEALPTILTNISTIDTLIASLPSDSSPTDPLVSSVDSKMNDYLNRLRNHCENFVTNGWAFFIDSALTISDHHKSSFRTIILDDPSFADLILNSLKLNHCLVRWNTIATVTNVVIIHPWMKGRFMTANLVGRMFEVVDYHSFLLSEPNTLCELTTFILSMLNPIGVTKEMCFQQYPLIRVSVFEPAKQFITFMFHNSDKQVVNVAIKAQLEDRLCGMHNHINNMELRSDEYDTDFVSELVKWEVRTMAEMEKERHFERVFEGMMDRTCEWKQDQRERLKRRKVLLREEGWDDGFELRVVAKEVNTNQKVKNLVRRFRMMMSLNANRL